MNAILLALVLAAPLPKALRDPDPQYDRAMAYLSGKVNYGTMDDIHPDLKALNDDPGMAWMLAEFNRPEGVRWGSPVPSWTVGDRYATLWWLNNLRNGYWPDPNDPD